MNEKNNHVVALVSYHLHSELLHAPITCPTRHDERQRAICSPLTFPVPGGPYSSKCGKLSLSINLVNMLTISSCATRSSSLAGRYFSTHGICMLSSGTVGRLLTLMVGLSSSVSIFAVSDMVVAVAWVLDSTWSTYLGLLQQ